MSLIFYSRLAKDYRIITADESAYNNDLVKL